MATQRAAYRVVTFREYRATRAEMGLVGALQSAWLHPSNDARQYCRARPRVKISF